jgi:hypothetical protein
MLARAFMLLRNTFRPDVRALTFVLMRTASSSLNVSVGFPDHRLDVG